MKNPLVKFLVYNIIGAVGGAMLFCLKTCYVIEAYVDYRKHAEMEALGLMSSRRPRRPAGDIDANGEPM